MKKQEAIKALEKEIMELKQKEKRIAESGNEAQMISYIFRISDLHNTLETVRRRNEH